MPSAMEMSDASCRPGIGIRSNSRNSVSTLSAGAWRAASSMGSVIWTDGALKCATTGIHTTSRTRSGTRTKGSVAIPERRAG